MDEQASFEPRAVLTRRRSGSNKLAVVVPAVALMGAVWLGSSGSNSEPIADNGQGAAVARASSGPSGVDPARPPQAGSATYPTEVLGLEVRTLADLELARLDGRSVIAIAAYYVALPSLGCPASSGVEVPGFVAELGVDADRRTFCERSGLFVATPNPAGSTLNIGGARDHPYRSPAAPVLPVTLTPGVVVPLELSGTTGAEAPTPVIMVGRLIERSQPSDQATSGPQLVVYRLASAGGIGQPQRTSILPKLLDQSPRLAWGRRDRLADKIIGPTGPILLEVLVDPATLAVVDPGAAALVAATSPNSTRIWYRMALGLNPGRSLAPWIAIDDTRGAVVGTGFVGHASVIVVGGTGSEPGPRLPADGTNVLTGG